MSENGKNTKWDELDVLKAKSTVISGLIWITERIGWASGWAYERLGGIRADLDQQYYSIRSLRKFEQERDRWDESRNV